MTDRTPFQYTPRTDEDIKQIAEAAISKQLVGSWMLPNKEAVQTVFMLLVFMDKETADEMEQQEITQCFEYIDKAGPRSVNGLPVFFSCQFLNQTDATKLGEKIEELLNGR